MKERLLFVRSLRGFVDGAVSVVLADYLLRGGLSLREVGALLTATLLGSAALTIAIGLGGGRRNLLAASGLLMAATGLGFAGLSRFAPLLVVAILGTLNPSAGDVSVFLPLEQAAIASATTSESRTSFLALYNLCGALAGAAGALAGGQAAAIASSFALDTRAAEQGVFLLYAAIGAVTAIVYRGGATRTSTRVEAAPLGPSRAIVIRLAALFSLDAFGGGFITQALLVVWLSARFGVSAAASGALFFATGVLAAFSQIVAARISKRLGLVKTMVYTHLPSNALLVLAGIAPTAPLALASLTLRAAISQMDVPTRQAYVLSVVRPEERSAAASLTSVPRSLAAALSPALAAFLLERSRFGWPLVAAGVLKAIYDVLLLVQFHAVPVRREDVIIRA